MRQTDLIVSVFQELKCLGVKVPKLKKFLSIIPKQAKSVPSSNKIFGINITEQEKVEVEKCLLPKFIVMAINYLKHHVSREGLFRKAGSVSRQKDLREKLENGQILQKAEPHDVACLLKQWLRELPERLIPCYLTDLFIRCINLQGDNRITAVSLCCHLLPFDHYCTLKYLLVFLCEIAQNSNKNKMGSHNLAVVMAPNIFMGPNSIDKSSNVLLDQYTSVIELLINNTHRIQPPCPSVHIAEAEALKCNTDLDVSIVLPDYSPSKLKKGVQDLIKKLVRKNSTSPPRKRPYQEDCNSDARQAITSPVLHDESLCYTPNSKIPKMASNTNEKSRKKRSRGKSFNLLKRKEKKRQKSEKSSGLTPKLNISASSPFQENMVSLSQVQAPVENKESFFVPPSISPINFKDLFTVKPNSMKKSYSDFYLIPNNEKFPNKIFSMSSEGCLPAENIPSPCHNITLKTADQMDSLKVPEVIFSQTSKSQKTENSSLVGTIEKSVSDTKIIRSKDKNDSIPSIEKTVSDTKIIRSKDKNDSIPSIEKTVSDTKIIRSKDKNDSMPSTEKTVSDTKIIRSKDVNDGVPSIEKTVSDTKIIKSKDINDGIPSTESVQSDIASSITSQLHSEKLKRNCTIRRQEVFIVKPKNSKRSTINQLKRADSIKISKLKNSQLKISHQNNTQMDTIQKSDSNAIAEMISVVNLNENNASSNNKKRTKRNASIVRGRPNTVKSGLPNDVCSRYSCDSFSYSNKHKSVSVSSSVDNDLFINVVQKNDHLPIINQMQNLTLSSPKEIISANDKFRTEVADFYDQIITSLENNASKTEITNCNDKITNSASITETASVSFVEADIVNEINVGSIIIKVEEPESLKIDDSKTVSKRKSREKLYSNFDNKVQKPKNSAKVSRINSFPEHSATTKQRKAKKLRAVKSSSPRKSCEKRSNFSDITDKENQYTQEFQQQTYLDVKTERVAKNSSLEPESIKTDHTKTQSKRKSRGRLSSNSDSKLHNSKKKSSKVSRINSFPEQAIIMKHRKVEKLRAVKSSSPRKSHEKRSNFSDITDKENQYTQESQQQTYLDVKSVRVVKDSSLEPESIETDDTKTPLKRKSRERLSSNSDSKIHNSKKKSPKVSRIKSFPEQGTNMKSRQVEKLRAVKSLSPRKSCEKKATVSENTDKENLCIEESQKYLDVKKTPKNKCESPEQWFSGRKFLEAEEAMQKENEMDCKRESIAMILRYNKGHVREKASIYEPDTRTTPMLLRSNTPFGKFCDPQYNKQSSHKKSTSTRSTRRNSPLHLPPIPLFFEPSPVSSHPFKELTNLSNSEEFFFTPPDKKSFNSSPNCENSPKNKKCTLKPKMKSFSGHTPYKLTVDRNKVCRSQSSPKCLSPSYTEIYHCSPILKAKSALSIERLKSDELLDEWNCEM